MFPQPMYNLKHFFFRIKNRKQFTTIRYISLFNYLYFHLYILFYPWLVHQSEGTTNTDMTLRVVSVLVSQWLFHLLDVRVCVPKKTE